MQVQSINQNHRQYKNTSFGLNNPQASLNRAKILNNEYAKYGLNYLLPGEVWSTKKIMQATQKAIDGFSNLLQNNNISIKSLNKLISNIIPKNIAEKIEIKDLQNDYPKLLKKDGYTDLQIENELKHISGITVPTEEKTIIFLPFENIQYSPYHQIKVKETFGHEFKHALTDKTTNINTSDLYKLKNKNIKDDLFKVFHIMERFYRIDDGVYFSPTELTEENFIKNIKNIQTNKTYNSINELTHDFKKTFDETLNKTQSLEHIDKNIINKFMQHFSKDEKEAYSTTKNMRECTFNKDMPIGAELNTLKYKFFEKFFKENSDIKS